MTTDGLPLTSGVSRSASRRFCGSLCRPGSAESFGGRSLDFVRSGASCTLGTSSRSQLAPKSRLGPGSGSPQANVGNQNPASLAVGRQGYLEASSQLLLAAAHSKG